MLNLLKARFLASLRNDTKMNCDTVSHAWRGMGWTWSDIHFLSGRVTHALWIGHSLRSCRTCLNTASASFTAGIPA